MERPTMGAGPTMLAAEELPAARCDDTMEAT